MPGSSLIQKLRSMRSAATGSHAHLNPGNFLCNAISPSSRLNLPDRCQEKGRDASAASSNEHVGSEATPKGPDRPARTAPRGALFPGRCSLSDALRKCDGAKKGCDVIGRDALPGVVGDARVPGNAGFFGEGQPV